MKGDLTRGPVMGTMLRFALPMIFGNLLQQCYNIADTLIVGRALGSDALAAVGSAFTLMTFLTSILLGLSMGSGAVCSIRFGQRDQAGLQQAAGAALALVALVTAALYAVVYLGLDWVQQLMQVPEQVWGLMRQYLLVIFAGIAGVAGYNVFACLLRAVGDSVTPLLVLAASAVANIGLDLWFVLGLDWGVAGAAAATVISQYGAAAAMAVVVWLRHPALRPRRITFTGVQEIAASSFLTCIQQSVMNLGILLVQGLVNSFGPAVMAAFAAGVKIDAFAYLPAQEFGNAFSTFIAQNHGAGQMERIRRGVRLALAAAIGFGLVASAGVWVLAEPLMGLFLQPGQTQILACGVQYLRTEGAFYWGIGCLFLFYGLFRALERPGMSVVLTVISLGTRVALAYALAAIEAVGVLGIWWSVPIGWALADLVGWAAWRHWRRKQETINT